MWEGKIRIKLRLPPLEREECALCGLQGSFNCICHVSFKICLVFKKLK